MLINMPTIPIPLQPIFELFSFSCFIRFVPID